MDFFFAVNDITKPLPIYLFVHLYEYLLEFICPMCMQGAEEATRGWWFPKSAASCCWCELPCGCWGTNPSPLQELRVLLNTEPALQP